MSSKPASGYRNFASAEQAKESPLFLFGKKKNQVERPVADWAAVSTIIRAQEQLEKRGDISSSRTAGIIYRHDDSNQYLRDLQANLKEALHAGEGATRTNFKIEDDTGGESLKWVILEDTDFRDLVSSVYTVGNALASNGAGEKLLAAVFVMFFTHGVRERDERAHLRVYWIYRYARHAYYPFVPTSDAEGERDRPSELNLGRLADGYGLKVERELEAWRGLWGVPF